MVADIVSATVILKEVLMASRPHWLDFLALVARELSLNLSTFRQYLNRSKPGVDIKLSWLPSIIRLARKASINISTFKTYWEGIFDQDDYPDAPFATLIYRAMKLIGHAGEINVQLDRRLTGRDAMASLEICDVGFKLFGTLRRKTLNAMAGIETGQEEMFRDGLQALPIGKVVN